MNEVNDEGLTPMEVLGKVWGERIEAAKDIRTPFIEASEVIDMYLQGDTDATFGEATLAEKFIKVSVPMFGPMQDSLIPAVTHQDPNVSVTAGDMASESAKARAAIREKVNTKANKEQRTLTQLQAAVWEAFQNGQGAIETDVDSERGGMPRSRWVMQRRLVIDPEWNGMPGTMRWAAVEFVTGVEAARKRYKDPEIKSDECADNDRAFNRDLHKDDGRPEQARLWRIWVLGDSPTSDEGNLDAATETGKAPFDEGYEGRNLRLIYDPLRKVILEKKEWGFVLDHDELPISIIRPVMLPGRPYSPSLYQPLLPLADSVNWVASFLATDMKDSSKKKWIAEKGTLDEEAMDGLESDESGTVVEINGAAGIEKKLKPLSLGGLSQAAQEGLPMMMGLLDSVSPAPDLKADSILKAEKASTAQIAAQRSENRLSLYADRIEQFALEVNCKQVMITELMTEKQVSDLLPEMGDLLKVAEWSKKRTPREIRLEIGVEIEPRSMRKISPEEMTDRLAVIYDRMMAQTSGLDQRLREDGYRIKPGALIRMNNWFAQKTAQFNSNIGLEGALLQDSDVEQIGGGTLAQMQQQMQQLGTAVQQMQQQTAQQMDGLAKVIQQLQQQIQEQATQFQQVMQEFQQANAAEHAQISATAQAAEERSKRVGQVVGAAVTQTRAA